MEEAREGCSTCGFSRKSSITKPQQSTEVRGKRRAETDLGSCKGRKANLTHPATTLPNRYSVI